MENLKKLKKQLNRRSVQIAIIVIIVVIILLLVLFGHHGAKMQVSQKEDLGKMMGIESTQPQKLESFKKVEGVLNIQHWVTKKGVRVYFVSGPSLPMVDIEVSFDAGAARNGDQGGLAYLTNQLLADGTAEMNADQVAENFENVGATFHSESLRDMAKVHLRSLSDPKILGSAVKTLSAILKSPAFPENGFKREQQHALTLLKQQAQTPQQIVAKAFFKALYPEQPYANWVLGDAKSINALTPHQLKDFYQKYYVAKNAVVTIVGDVSASDADVIAQTLTNHLPEGEKAPALPNVLNLKQQTTDKIAFPSAQTHILIGQPAMKQGDPDFYPLYVGNHILGGSGMVSRLFMTVRNQHGLAYSVYSYFQPMAELGPYVLGCQTRNDQAEKSLSLIQQLLRDFIAKGPSEKELDDAKKNLIGGYALQFDSNASILTQVSALGFYNLPLDYFDRFKPSVEKLTVDEIKAAFQRRIQPDVMAVVMVGGVGEQPQQPKQGANG